MKRLSYITQIYNPLICNGARPRQSSDKIDHYELPEESLAAGIPMNMRTRREITEDNNQVGSMFCEIHTNIAGPVERLAAAYSGQ